MAGTQRVRGAHLRRLTVGLAVGSLVLLVLGPLRSVMVRVIAVRTGATGGGVVLSGG